MLKSLNTPNLGDSLLRTDGTPWMTQLAHGSTKLNWDDLGQVAALPLGSWLKTDPWDDRVHMLNAKRYAPMNPRDKMPLEVTPVYYKLQRYNAAGLAPANAGGPGQPAGGDSNGAPAPTTAPGQPGANQPAPPPAAGQPVPADAAAQQNPPAAAPQ